MKTIKKNLSRIFERKLGWGFLTLLGISLIGIGAFSEKTGKKTSYEDFKAQAVITEEQEHIGTFIKLHQEIHDADITYYRYKLETDCDYWHYEDRYISRGEPLDIGTKKYDAVGTDAVAVTISYDGEPVMTGQHFYVPLLNLYMDDMTYEEYKEGLLKNAYDQYLASGKGTADPIWNLLGTLCFIMVIILVYNKYDDKREEEQKTLATKNE